MGSDANNPFYRLGVFAVKEDGQMLLNVLLNLIIHHENKPVLKKKVLDYLC